MRIEPGEGQGCEPPTPKCVAEYDHRVATNLILGESASKSRLDAQQWKEVRSNAGSLQPRSSSTNIEPLCKSKECVFRR